MGLSYKKAGVDIDKANLLLEAVKKIVGSSRRREVLGGIGGFGAFFDLQQKKYKEPVLVSSCDGVGTKLKIAILAGIHDTVGVDLVAMSVNDVLCSGAEPLFFLDYIAAGKIDANVFKSLIKGVVAGCREARCSLIGGETAEMPGMYKPGEYDLAGFCVGIVEKKKIIGVERVRMGDAVIGLESSGLHSNGFSLVRRVFSQIELKSRAGEFLKPTRIYVKPVLAAVQRFNSAGCGIKAAAHITGGAFFDKAVRVVPKNTTMVLYKNAWPKQELFEEIKERGKVSEKEMFHTFNMGIGMVLVVKDDIKMDVVRHFARGGLKSFIIGEMISGVGGVVVA